jgi:hypothetical protein
VLEVEAHPGEVQLVAEVLQQLRRGLDVGRQPGDLALVAKGPEPQVLGDPRVVGVDRRQPALTIEQLDASAASGADGDRGAVAHGVDGQDQ